MGQKIDLEQTYSVVSLPVNAVEVAIAAKVWNDGEIIEVTCKMSMQDVKDAIKEAETGYFPEDAVYTITEKGKEMLRQQGYSLEQD